MEFPWLFNVDDGLGGGFSAIKAKINSLTVRADLTRYGFFINEEKSLLGTCPGYYLARHCF